MKSNLLLAWSEDHLRRILWKLDERPWWICHDMIRVWSEYIKALQRYNLTSISFLWKLDKRSRRRSIKLVFQKIQNGGRIHDGKCQRILFLPLTVQKLLAYMGASLSCWWCWRVWDSNSKFAVVTFQTVPYLWPKFPNFPIESTVLWAVLDSKQKKNKKKINDYNRSLHTCGAWTLIKEQQVILFIHL